MRVISVTTTGVLFPHSLLWASVQPEKEREKGLLQKQCHSIRESGLMFWDNRKSKSSPMILTCQLNRCVHSHINQAGVHMHISVCLRCLRCIKSASIHESRIDLINSGCFVSVMYLSIPAKSLQVMTRETLYGFFYSPE